MSIDTLCAQIIAAPAGLTICRVALSGDLSVGTTYFITKSAWEDPKDIAKVLIANPESKKAYDLKPFYSRMKWENRSVALYQSKQYCVKYGTSLPYKMIVPGRVYKSLAGAALLATETENGKCKLINLSTGNYKDFTGFTNEIAEIEITEVVMNIGDLIWRSA